MRYKDFAQVLFLLATATGFRPLWMAKSPLNLMLNFKSSVEDKPMSLQPQSGLTYRVKEASFHDLSSVIMLRLVVFYPTLRSDQLFKTRLLDKLRRRFEQGSKCYLATKDGPVTGLYLGNLIGTIEINGFDFYNTTMENIGYQKKLYLADLAVRPDCRQMGIATKLLKQVEDYAVANNYQEIYLHVAVHNEPARQLYMKHGYSILPPTSDIMTFTEQHLQRPSEQYHMLWKDLTIDEEHHFGSEDVSLIDPTILFSDNNLST